MPQSAHVKMPRVFQEGTFEVGTDDPVLHWVAATCNMILSGQTLENTLDPRFSLQGKCLAYRGVFVGVQSQASDKTTRSGIFFWMWNTISLSSPLA